MINVVVDLSHHNTVSDFSTIKADGIVGVIHKATQGTSYVDPTYNSRRSQALGCGLWWGAYHFGTGSDGGQQAEYFLSTVDPGPNDLLVLDFEEDTSGGSSMTLSQAEQFVSFVQNKTGRWPGIYGGSYLKQVLGNTPSAVSSNCWFWLAQYGTSAVVPTTWPTWTMWQYTDGTNGPQPHSVNGVGNCDRDKFNGDMNGLSRLWGHSI